MIAFGVFVWALIACAQAPADPQATAETRCLFSHLYKFQSTRDVLFGHHHSNYQGQNFQQNAQGTGDMQQSDVKQLTGQYPAFFEYNLNKVLSDGVNFTNEVLAAVEMGAMVGFHWEAENPVTGGDDKDTSGHPVQQLMPGGTGNANWLSYLDGLAAFLETLVFPASMGFGDNTPIPFIFRLFHECLGDWYWWGQDYCTADEYISAFNYTRDYLVNTKGLHNLLFIYAPNKPSMYYDTYDQYGERWPGDSNVDIAGWDHYSKDNICEGSNNLLDDAHLVIPFAQKHEKIAAIGEFGVSNGLQETNMTDWFMQAVYNPIWTDETAWSIAYFLTWANFNPDHYWTPLAGQLNANSFQDFEQQVETYFQQEALSLSIYTC